MMEIWLSRHAKEQARERGISIKEIAWAIQRGAKHPQEKGKIVADFMHVRIVYRIIREKYFVITVMIRK